MNTLTFQNSFRNKVDWQGHRLILGFLILFAVVVSVFALSGESLRLDESQSLWQSSHSVERIIDIVGQDVHVPLYHLVLRYWQATWQGGVESARFLSLIFFVFSIPLMYMVGIRAFGNRGVALFSAILLAISPFLNWYANEIRMYSMLIFLTLLSHYFFISIYERKTVGSWVGYTMTAVVGVYTHYFFGLIIASQMLFFLFTKSTFPPRAGRNFMVSLLVLALALLPWFLYLESLGRLAGTSQPMLPVPTSVDAWNAFSQFMVGFQLDFMNSLFVSLWPLSVLVAFLLLRRHATIPKEVAYFLLALIVPTVLLFTASVLFKPVYVARYLIITVPALYLLIAWVLSTYPRWIASIVQGGLVLAMLAALITQTQNTDMPMREDYRGAALYLNAQARESDIIVLSAPFTIYPVEYYYTGPADIRTIPDWDRMVRGPIPPFNPESLDGEVGRMTGDYQRVFLLLSYDQGYQKDVKKYFDNNYHMLTHQNFSPKLDLYVYKVRYDATAFEPALTAN